MTVGVRVASNGLVTIDATKLTAYLGLRVGKAGGNHRYSMLAETDQRAMRVARQSGRTTLPVAERILCRCAAEHLAREWWPVDDGPARGPVPRDDLGHAAITRPDRKCHRCGIDLLARAHFCGLCVEELGHEVAAA